MHVALSGNSTFGSSRPPRSGSVYTSREGIFEGNGRTAVICVSVVIASALLLLGALLGYRELCKRRSLADMKVERSRREAVRQAVRLRLQELQDSHLQDAISFQEHADARAPLVTFGGIEILASLDSTTPQSLSLQNQISTELPPRYLPVFQLVHLSQARSKINKPRVHHIPYRRHAQQLSLRQQHLLKKQQRARNGSPNQPPKLPVQPEIIVNNSHSRLQTQCLPQEDENRTQIRIGDETDPVEDIVVDLSTESPLPVERIEETLVVANEETTKLLGSELTS